MILSTPFVWVDMQKMNRNIEHMAAGHEKYGITHRPHIKTHKSVEIARMQLDAGATGITCSKISEANIMAKAGIKDILIAYSLVGQDKMDRLNAIMDIADIKVTVDNMVSAQQLSDLGIKRNEDVKVYIELATHIKRGGVKFGDELVNFAKELSGLKGITLEGLFGYIGLKPNLKTREQLKGFAEEEMNNMLEAKTLLANNGFNIKYLSGGSSITSNFPKEISGLTESRAGNYVFYDMNSVYLGVVSINQCALKVKATIISIPDDGYATIDAGSKTFGSDTKENIGYGYIVGYPDAKIYKLNEEHGYVYFNSLKQNFKIGQTIDVIPNHSCILPNLCDYIFGFEEDQFVKRFQVDARGKNY